VRIRDGRESGEVQEIRGTHATVLCGNARLRIALIDLRKEQQKTKQYSVSSSAILTPEAPNEIDLRGLLGDEAIARVQVSSIMRLLQGCIVLILSMAKEQEH